MEQYEQGPDRIRYTERDFKVCGLCGALNPVTNTKCFVCSWSGIFHSDRETIRDVMNELESDQGRIDESLFFEEVVPSTLPRPGLWSGIWRALRKIFSRA